MSTHCWSPSIQIIYFHQKVGQYSIFKLIRLQAESGWLAQLSINIEIEKWRLVLDSLMWMWICYWPSLLSIYTYFYLQNFKKHEPDFRSETKNSFHTVRRVLYGVAFLLHRCPPPTNSSWTLFNCFPWPPIGKFNFLRAGHFAHISA